MIKLFVLASAVLALMACGRSEAPRPASAPVAAAARSDLPPITVHKNTNCSCCKAWVNHLRTAGFAVEAQDVMDLNTIRQRAGVPDRLRSCHTAQVGGYFIEGHVPAEDIERLLRERPKARGLAVPGMPIGSPGMENSSRKVQPYDVLIISAQGQESVYAHHGQ